MQMQRDELEQRIQQQNEELSIQKDEFNQQLQAQATTVDYLLSSIQSLTKQMSEIQNLGPTSETHEPRFPGSGSRTEYIKEATTSPGIVEGTISGDRITLLKSTQEEKNVSGEDTVRNEKPVISADAEFIYGNAHAQQQMTFEPEYMGASNREQVIGSGQLGSPTNREVIGSGQLGSPTAGHALEFQDSLPLPSPQFVENAALPDDKSNLKAKAAPTDDDVSVITDGISGNTAGGYRNTQDAAPLSVEKDLRAS